MSTARFGEPFTTVARDTLKKEEGPGDEAYAGLFLCSHNDHVLSFDCQYMGLSDHTQHPQNQSLIYVLPSEGGQPERVTPNAPSWLHGCWPDGSHIAFVSNTDRNN